MKLASVDDSYDYVNEEQSNLLDEDHGKKLESSSMLCKNETLSANKVKEFSSKVWGDEVLTPPAQLRKWKVVTGNLHLLSREEEPQSSSVSDTSSNSNGDSDHSSNFEFNRTNDCSDDQKKDKKFWFSSNELLGNPFFKKLKDTVKSKTKVRQTSPKTFFQSIIADRKKCTPLKISDKERFENNYKVLSQIGSGGHSVVKLATEKKSGRQVVCKFIQNANVWHWSPKNIPLEIETLQNFRHENIINLYDYFSLGENEWILVMEYLGSDWIDLYDYIEYYGPVNEEHTKHIFRQVLDVIEFMHQKGYSHNDIKGDLNK